MIDRAFLDWMDTAPAAQRADAVAALALSCIDPASDEETRTAVEAALTLILDDPAPEVRRALAVAIAGSAHAPRHIVLGLAGDQPDIATIILGQSPALIDAELVDIVAAADEPLQTAIARRPVLSGAVAASIAEVGEREACAVMIANSGAAIARISFRRLAERFGDDVDMREALLARADLPADVRQLIVRIVTDALGNLAIARGWVPEGRLRDLTRDACDRATVAIAAESETQELPALVEHLRATGQLTTALLLRAVCAGNIPFFEAALGALAHVPPERIASLLRAGRLSGLRAIYAKAGLPPLAFDAFAAAIDTWRRIAGEGVPLDRYRFTRQIVEAVLSRYADITDGEANELAAMLRRFAADQTRDAARATARSVAAEPMPARDAA